MGVSYMLYKGLGAHGFGAHSRLSNITCLKKPETVHQHNAV